MNNEYLTKKAKRGHKIKFTLAGISLFIAYASIMVLMDYLKEKRWDMVITVGIIAALLVLPFVRTMIDYQRCGQAKQLASSFPVVVTDRIPLDRADDILKIEKVEEKVRHLLKKGYLQQISIDWETRSLVLMVANENVLADSFIKIRCSNCGAENMMLKGRIGQCPYCDAKIIGKE